jgi:hypothetical protein
MILVWEDFSFYDNHYYTLYTLRGHNTGWEIWPDAGRFIPFGDQEFNVVRHFTNTITGYHAVPIVQLVLLICIILILDAELGITARVVLATIALLSPSILISFSGLIFQERDFLFFLACLVLSVKRFERTHSIAWAVTAVLCAQIMIFYKETAFLLLLGFAVGRLILRCKDEHHAGWVYDRLWDKESRLDLCLASLSMMFLVYYLAVMRFHLGMKYATTAELLWTELVLNYMRIDLLAWLFVAFTLGRIYLILRHRLTPLLLWDGLALGGVACFFAYLYLMIFSTYYMAPVDFIAVLYLGRFVVLSWKSMRPRGKIAATLVASAVMLQDVVVSAYAIFEQKNVIRGKAEISSVIESQYRSSGGGRRLTLFFPFAHHYVIMEFASYLDYRGIPVEGAVGEAIGPGRVALAAKTISEDGRCVEWESIRCHAANGPAPGDLVIVLPDDQASLAEASVYQERGELLFSYQPHPSIPHWFRSLFDSLHLAATRNTDKTNSDRWLYGSVTRWSTPETN